MKSALTRIGGVVLAVALSLTIATSGLAQSPTPGGAVTTSGAQGVEVTVYNSNIGLVKEVRALDLTAGVNEVRFTDVAAGIDATSVQVISLTDPEGTAVLEQNYEYDIVGSSKLLQKYIDLEISLTMTEGQVYTGTLLSASDDVILATAEGIRLIKASQIREFAFPSLPEGLITKPTLVWLLDAATAGEQDLRVTYMTGGLNWQADYVAMLSEDDTTLSLNGWVTVDNNSGTTYRDAKLKLVAGDVNRVVEDKVLREEVMYAAAPAATPAPQVAERSLFEYHLYEVQRPVTLKDAQTKQIEFVSAPQILVDKVFVYESLPSYFWSYGGVYNDPSYGVGVQEKIRVLIEFTNSEEAGLGLPLPQGTMRVYKEDVGGGAEFIGEDSIEHTPKDEDMSLFLGNAFDLVGERRQVEYRQLGERSAEETIEISLRNHKTEDVTIRVLEHLFRALDAQITNSSAEYTMASANTAEYNVAVPADGEVLFTYTVRYRW